MNSVGGPALRAEGLTLGYEGRTVSEDLDLDIPTGGLTVIVGPNACGKSTLLRALARLLSPQQGRVLLDGADVHRMKSKDLARRLGMLPQSSISPDAIKVTDLVARGRHPHQSVWRQWSPQDTTAVTEAMTAAGVLDLADRYVDELSGGQRQRVWIAMLLAQETPYLLLDEPTTYLDIAHQIELMELLTDLHRAGRTVVAVLHELNQAARYATHLVAMRDGAVVASGPPRDVVTPDLIGECFGLPVHVIADPISGAPLVIPIGRADDRAPLAAPLTTPPATQKRGS
ncbi:MULTISPECIES: ABC transporter ATP-binding protein [unclassified Microbacterium]|uniref:ABC transporter ATP-binding protein n=1 Tax=unclassified Microbacterium TaxID=2609290 RepID=UPI00301AE803